LLWPFFFCCIQCLIAANGLFLDIPRASLDLAKVLSTWVNPIIQHLKFKNIESNDAESRFRQVDCRPFLLTPHLLTYCRLATVAVPVCFVAGWIASSERDGMIRRDLDEEARYEVDLDRQLF
jgi:hypothetical protein